MGIISVGWDPGLFSLNRIYAESILPNGKTYTFWGKGVSQGHSDAIRRVAGVKRGIQYTIPVPEAVEEVRACKNPELTTRQKHTRECFIVAEEGADLQKIEEEIKTMPNYFSDYDTTVHFISEEEFDRDHTAMPHGGFVIRTGKTGKGEKGAAAFIVTADASGSASNSAGFACDVKGVGVPAEFNYLTLTQADTQSTKAAKV